MNKKEVNAQMKTIDLGEYGAPNGNKWQQEHAKIVETYFQAPEDELITQVLYGLQDLQVRDYALGIMNKTNLLHFVALEKLVKFAPAKYAKAPLTLLAILRWESGNKEQAEHILTKVKNYNLAILMDRVFKANWHPSQLDVMRKELHHKVKENIFENTQLASV